jgi:formiminotetrahydrofolate cyclodeaminase
VLGGALAAVWRNITAHREAKAAEDAKERDREIERNDKIRAELISLVALYNGVKSVRRIVRSLGLDPGIRQSREWRSSW